MSGNIRDEAAHIAEVEVPELAASEVDVTEVVGGDDFSIVETDDDGNVIEKAALVVADDDNNKEEA